jgi:hypothetical protein
VAAAGEATVALALYLMLPRISALLVLCVLLAINASVSKRNPSEIILNQI